MNNRTNAHDAFGLQLELKDAVHDLSVEELPEQYDLTTVAQQPGTASTLGSGSCLGSCAFCISSASSWVP